jgi:hypothetical protein
MLTLLFLHLRDELPVYQNYYYKNTAQKYPESR